MPRTKKKKEGSKKSSASSTSSPEAEQIHLRIQPGTMRWTPDVAPLFSPAGITAILKACKENCVSEITLGALHVRFGRPAETTPIGQDDRHTGKAMPEPDHDKQNDAALEAEELSLREQQIADLTITDPLEAERLMQLGMLRGDGADTHEEE